MRQCAFCPETANLTGEHIWSAWIGRLFDPKSTYALRNTKQGVVSEWRSSELNLKVNVVCNKCNSRLGATVEDVSKPLLQYMILAGSQVTLLPDGMRTVAVFALKNLIVAHEIDARRPASFISQLERRDFGRTLQLPANIQVWMAAANEPRGLFKTWYGQFNRAAVESFEVYALTYSVGFWIFQITASRWLDRKRRKHDIPPILSQGRFWEDASVYCWPPTTDAVGWPPDKLLDKEVSTEFSRRWRTIHLP